MTQLNMLAEEITVDMSRVNNNRFGKCIDEEGSILRDAILYYKKIKDSQYLIFAHFNHDKKKREDGFDAYIVMYETNSLSYIGKRTPSSLEAIKFSLPMNGNLELIAEYQELIKSSSDI